MLYIHNNKILFCASKCTQCGVCLSVCPRKAISSHRGGQIYNIKVDDTLCIKCGLCVSSCASNLLPISSPEAKLVNNGQCYLAYNADKTVRSFASSGGFCRTIINEALALRLVDSAYSLAYSSGNEEELSGKWFTSVPPTNDLPQSIYRVVLWGEHILEMPDYAQRILLVGLPCQLRAANAILKRKNPSLDIVNVAILCRKTKTLGFSKYIARMCGNGKASLRSIRYRGEGWPGAMRVDGSARSIGFVYHAFCWNLQGCRRCFDSYYIEGDFTVGDPWEIVERSSDENGQSLLFVHSNRGKTILEKMEQLRLTPISANVPSEIMGLEHCRNKEFDYKSHPNNIRFFQKIKKIIGETVLSIKSFLNK